MDVEQLFWGDFRAQGATGMPAACGRALANAAIWADMAAEEARGVRHAGWEGPAADAAREDLDAIVAGAEHLWSQTAEAQVSAALMADAVRETLMATAARIGAGA